MGIELLARDTTGLTVLMLDISPQPCWMVHVLAASVECLRHRW